MRPLIISSVHNFPLASKPPISCHARGSYWYIPRNWPSKPPPEWKDLTEASSRSVRAIYIYIYILFTRGTYIYIYIYRWRGELYIYTRRYHIKGGPGFELCLQWGKGGREGGREGWGWVGVGRICCQ